MRRRPERTDQLGGLGSDVISDDCNHPTFTLGLHCPCPAGNLLRRLLSGAPIRVCWGRTDRSNLYSAESTTNADGGQLDPEDAR